MPDFLNRGTVLPFLLLAGFSPVPASSVEDSARGDTAGIAVGILDFIERSARNDLQFQEILIEQLELQYRRTLAVPPRDLVLSVRGELGLSLDGEPQTGLDAGITQLFPRTGSSVSLDWQRRSFGSIGAQNDVTLQAGVDIARNAFGRDVRWADTLAGLENEVARHQIIEAYEEYLAAILERYYQWAAAWESMRAARVAMDEAGRLVENTERKQRSQIAYQVDVDKTKLQLLGERQRLLEAEDSYDRLTLEIAHSLGYPPGARLLPDSASLHLQADGDWEDEQRTFFASGRTMRVLSLFEERDSLATVQAADNLLPSAQVFTGIGWGDGPGSVAENTRGFVGVSFDLGWKRPHERAERQLARIEWGRSKLATQHRQGRLRTDLDALRRELRARDELLLLARERETLTDTIHRAENEEYRNGRSDINDLIRALEDFQNARFQRISREIERNMLIVEWRRVTDQLVTARDAESTPMPKLEDWIPGEDAGR